MKDPIVEEVRANRAALTRDCGGTLKAFLAQEREFFAHWKGKKITKPLHPEWCPPARVGAVAEASAEYGKARK
jgi:hypothetical protein